MYLSWTSSSSGWTRPPVEPTGTDSPVFTRPTLCNVAPSLIVSHVSHVDDDWSYRLREKIQSRIAWKIVQNAATLQRGNEGSRSCFYVAKKLFCLLLMQAEMRLPLSLGFEGDRNGSSRAHIRLWVELLDQTLEFLLRRVGPHCCVNSRFLPNVRCREERERPELPLPATRTS